MAIGPGQYDEEVTELRERLQASGIVLMVAGGNRGHGFSAQLDLQSMMLLPRVLRELADQIEADAQRIDYADH